jgi:hypothetical protein
MKIEDLRSAIRGKRIRVTDHADEEAADDDLVLEEVEQSVLCGEIIEDYQSDKPLPSCLVLGTSEAGEPVHSVWGYNEVTTWAVLITVYRPDPARWIGNKIRRT